MLPLRLLLLFLFITAVCCEQYKLLILLPMAGRSHKNFFVPLMEGLAARGHDVTVISPIKPTEIVPNLTEITIEDNVFQVSGTDKKTEEGPAKKQQAKEILEMSPLLGFKFVSKALSKNCRTFLNFPATKELVKKGKVFDLVIVQGFVNECAVSVGAMIGRNMIYVSQPATPGIGLGATPRPPSYVQTFLVGFPSKMDFFDRLKNAFYSIAMIWSYDYYIVSQMQEVVTESLPEAPSIAEALKQIRFIIYNADPVLTLPHPGMPNIMSVGGLHCKDAKPLPKDFEDFIQSSGEHGFVYFSLGSNFRSETLPIEIRQAFLSAFSRLKQKVIWKYGEDLPGKPENVMITKWAPQQDVLGHPKIRLFISHGGLLSMQETVYHGTPVIGIPLYGDQPSNVFRVQELKIGEGLEWSNISEASIYGTINKILNDKNYAENMKKYSSIFRDQPDKPLDRAIFWTEYVIRHEGAQHLRSAAEDLNFFQYFLLDVIALILALILGATWIFVKTVKFVWKTWFVKNKSVNISKKTN